MSDATRLPIFANTTLTGTVNVPHDGLLANIGYAVRQQHAQVWPCPPNTDEVCIVGGGPSLAATERDLVALVHGGAKLVTTNGAYGWCLERNLKPHAQIIVDARPSNARFVEPDVPDCRYYLASQCDPSVWDAVRGRPYVVIFHAIGDQDIAEPLLNAFYLGHWHGVAGGSTVATRAIGLLTLIGYRRFHLFGVDSCWMDGHGHAFPQPENEQDECLRVELSPPDHPEMARTFRVSPWHLAQAEDMMRFIAVAGQHFLLNIHGDGLLAFMLHAHATIQSVDGAVASSASTT